MPSLGERIKAAANAFRNGGRKPSNPARHPAPISLRKTMRDNRSHDGWFCTGKLDGGAWCDQRFTDAEASDQHVMFAAVRDDDLDDLPF